MAEQHPSFFTRELFEYIREHPGVTGAELRKHFHDRPVNTVSNTVSRLRREGMVENRGRGGPWSNWHALTHCKNCGKEIYFDREPEFDVWKHTHSQENACDRRTAEPKDL